MRLIGSLTNEVRLTHKAIPVPAGAVHHQLTHLSVTLHIFVTAVGLSPALTNRHRARWVAGNGRVGLSMSTAQKKALRAAAKVADWPDSAPVATRDLTKCFSR